MELKDFIKGTIKAIAESVKELNDELADIGVVVNPEAARFVGDVNKMIYNPTGKDKSIIHEIEFNLSITEAKDSKADGGVKIAVINASINSTEKIENLNTVRFSLPVVLPLSKS